MRQPHKKVSALRARCFGPGVSLLVALAVVLGNFGLDLNNFSW